jgi:hypothetical protein
MIGVSISILVSFDQFDSFADARSPATPIRCHGY